MYVCRGGVFVFIDGVCVYVRLSREVNLPLHGEAGEAECG